MSALRIWILRISSLSLSVMGTLVGADGMLRHSDVVLTHPPESKSIVERYGATMVAWGFLPGERVVGDEDLVEEWRQEVDDARALSLKFQGRVEFDAGWIGMVEFEPDSTLWACSSFEGEPIRYPWFWDREHKGVPAYWICTNSPSFRAFLREEVRMALSENLDTIMVDAQTSTRSTLRYWGCFCQWCMTGFRDYLRENVKKEILHQHGIENVEHFDYRDFLRKKQVEWTTDLNALLDLPLGAEFVSFQYKQAEGLVEWFHKCVKELGGGELPTSLSSTLIPTQRAYGVQYVDFLCSELHFDTAMKAVPFRPVYTYKLAEALGKKVIATALPRQDWREVLEGDLDGLVRTWIAQSYAFGANFMVPIHQWAYGLEEEGVGSDNFYESKPGDYEDLYQFVREHAGLLDGYDAVTTVGLLYNNRAMRKDDSLFWEAFEFVWRKSLPFRIVVAGDDWLPHRLNVEILDGLDRIVRVDTLPLDPQQQAVLDTFADRIVHWTSAEVVSRAIPDSIRVTGADNIQTVPRIKQGALDVPYVCHLLNRNYISENDSMQVQQNFQLSIETSLFGSRITSAVLHAAGQDPVVCDIRQDGNRTEIEIPMLELWGLLKLQHE